MIIDVELKEAIKRVKQLFDSEGIKSCIVGAFVPYLEIALKLEISSRQTMDIDYVVNINSWKRFEEVKSKLTQYGFRKTRYPHRLEFGEHSIIDIIPYSRKIVKNGKLEWPNDGFVMHVGGLDRLFEDSKELTVFDNVKWMVAPIPIFILNKISAYEDRKLAKDMLDIFFCLKNYEGDVNSDARFEVIGDFEDLVWEFAGAYVLGKESSRYLNKNSSGIINKFLNRFISFEVPTIDIVLREEGYVDIDDKMRQRVFDLLMWFKKGLERK